MIQENTTTQLEKQSKTRIGERSSSWRPARGIIVATGHVDTAALLNQRLGLPVTQFPLPAHFKESVKSTEAVLGKLEEVIDEHKGREWELPAEYAILATDVTTFFGDPTIPYGKIERYEAKIVKDLQERYPGFAFERDEKTYELTSDCRLKIADWLTDPHFAKKEKDNPTESSENEEVVGGWYSEERVGGWVVVFGVRMPNGAIRLAKAIIQVDVPKLGKDVVAQYLSEEVSGGIGLLQFMRDLERDPPQVEETHTKGIRSGSKAQLEKWRLEYSKPTYVALDGYEEPIEIITGQMAEDLIRKKVPPKGIHLRLLMHRLFLNAETVEETLDLPETGELTFIYSIAAMNLSELLDWRNPRTINLQDGQRGVVVPITREVAPDVSAMMHEYLDQQATGGWSGADFDTELEKLEEANAIETLVEKDAPNPDLMAMVAVYAPDESWEFGQKPGSTVLGYLRMDLSEGKDGEPVADIKRMYARSGQLQLGFSQLVELAERIALAQNVGMLRRGSAINFQEIQLFMMHGFKSTGPLTRAVLTGETFQTMEKKLIFESQDTADK